MRAEEGWMVLWFKPREQDFGNQGSVAPDKVPSRCSASAPAARRAMLQLLLQFLATAVPRWPGCCPAPSFPGPWHSKAISSATTAPATLLCGAFHVLSARSAALSSQ